jgi:hypothetical protein
MAVDPDIKHIERWEKIRRSGRWKYIWLRCTLGWAVTAAILWLLLALASERQGDHWRTFLAVLPFCMLIGHLFGASLWKANERKYREYQGMTARQKSGKPDALES